MIVDISHRISVRTPPYPGDTAPGLELYRQLDADGYTAYYLKTGLHAGTHLDLPMHMLEDARTAADFDPSLFIGRGVLLDVRGESRIAMRPEYEQLVRAGDVVLLRTGWEIYYEKAQYFTEHPVVSDELCDFLVERGVKILGFDMPAPDYVPFVRHKRLLQGGVFLLENAANLGVVDTLGEFELIALPLKIEAEASLVRAVCRTVD